MHVNKKLTTLTHHVPELNRMLRVLDPCWNCHGGDLRASP